jgi:hypothetical protein
MRMRGRMYEQIGNIRRAAELQAPFSPTLETWLSAGRAVGRRDLERVFAHELDRLPHDVRKRKLAMVNALAGGQLWDQLRQPLDIAAARKATVDAIIAVLEREE